MSAKVNKSKTSMTKKTSKTAKVSTVTKKSKNENKIDGSKSYKTSKTSKSSKTVSNDRSLDVEPKCKNASADDKPTLESILDEADAAFTDIVRKYLVLGESLVKAITWYGSAGKKAFRTRFPLTDNAIRNLEMVGRGRLLPQFAMCSDRFVKGLLEMEDSLMWQFKLIGASENGMIRVRIDGDIVDAKFEDLKSGAIDGVLSVISSSDKDLTPEQICEKLCTLRKTVRSKFAKDAKPLYEIRTDGERKVVRFFRSRPFTADDLRSIISKLESNE